MGPEAPWQILAWTSTGEQRGPYLGTTEQKLFQRALGCQQDTVSVTAGDTVEGLGWLRSYWESRGLQPGGTRKATD